MSQLNSKPAYNQINKNKLKKKRQNTLDHVRTIVVYNEIGVDIYSDSPKSLSYSLNEN